MGRRSLPVAQSVFFVIPRDSYPIASQLALHGGISCRVKLSLRTPTKAGGSSTVPILPNKTHLSMRRTFG
ncbi:hypothetical protein QF002_000475 [Paraburkholderia youngii]